MSHAASDWMPFEWADFWDADAVLGMDNDAALLYLWLLGWQWRDGSLPGDPKTVRRAVPARFVESFDRAWPQIEACVPLCEDGRRRNPRVSRDLESAARRLTDARSNGAKGARARLERLSRVSGKGASSHPQASLEPASSDPQALNGSERNGTKQNGQSTTPPPPTPSGQGGDASKRERTPEQKAKDAEKAKHREAGKRVWQEAWAEHRDGSEPFEFADKHSTILRRIHEKHGSEKLRAKCDALLSDMEPWVHKNASPSLLATRWSQLGQATPRRMTQAELNVQETMAAADEIDAIEARAAARRNGQ